MQHSKSRWPRAKRYNTPMTNNPFTQRGRITNPEFFIGRWIELSLIFERIEAAQPVIISGVPAIGVSSVLTHVVQAAAANLEEPSLRTFYLDIRQASDSETIYATLISALGSRGSNLSAFELALIELGHPVLIALDNADMSMQQDWGVHMLEAFARLVRRSPFMLLIGIHGRPPLLSERFGSVRLGAFQPTEVRLLGETYLEETGMHFSPAEYAELQTLSAAHPAYVQRAAFHLFESKYNPDYQWKLAYLREARERPIPGAALPAAIFEGRAAQEALHSSADFDTEGLPRRPDAFSLPESQPGLGLILLLIIALVLGLWLHPLAGVLAAILGIAVFVWHASR